MVGDNQGVSMTRPRVLCGALCSVMQSPCSSRTLIAWESLHGHADCGMLVLPTCQHTAFCLACTPLALPDLPTLCAACPAVECSHSAELNPAAAANWRPARGGRLHRPSNSLISTAVQPASPRGHPHQPVSPKLDRANSVVSHTARPHGRAGTPASMYGPAAAGFLLPGRARHNSPARNLAGDQVRLCVCWRSGHAVAAHGDSQHGSSAGPSRARTTTSLCTGVAAGSSRSSNWNTSCNVACLLTLLLCGHACVVC
jgi:hypothetical protein